MIKFSLTVLCLLGLVSTASAQGGGYYERYWNGYGWCYRYCYQQPYVAPVVPVIPQAVAVAPVYKKENNVTVVNNLIGIPVPVQYNQPIAGQGNTVYGYSTVAEAHGSVDLGLLYNQAHRLTDQAQQLAGQAATDFHTLVQAEGQNRTEVAKIVAQGQAARDALLAAKGPTGVTAQQQFRSFTFRVVQDGSGAMKVEPTTPATPEFNFNLSSPAGKGAGNVSELIKSRCVSCHGNEKASGGLNFLQAITDAQQTSVLERITTADATKRMPPKGQLGVADINLFFQAMGAQK